MDVRLTSRSLDAQTVICTSSGAVTLLLALTGPSGNKVFAVSKDYEFREGALVVSPAFRRLFRQAPGMSRMNALPTVEMRPFPIRTALLVGKDAQIEARVRDSLDPNTWAIQHVDDNA